MAQNRHALVLGGCGNVGSGVIGGFLRRGYSKVAVLSRDPMRLDTLRTRVGPELSQKVVYVVGDVGNEEGAEAALNEVLRQMGGRLDDVVCCIGFSWWQQGLMRDQPKIQVESALNSLVVAPFVAYKYFIRAVQNSETGTFTFVTGGGADMFLSPGTGMMSIGGAGAQGLARVALKEHAQEPVTVTEVSFLAGVTPVPDQMPPGFVWIFNQDAGDAITSVVEKRSGRGRTSTVKTMDDINKLKCEGQC